jgi:hypothetical protein
MPFFQASLGRIAYEVLRPSYLAFTRPLVLIGGLTSIKEDWEPLSSTLAQRRAGLLTYIPGVFRMLNLF